MQKILKTSDIDILNLDVKGYKYVVLLREHYRGNGCGEYFAVSDYETLKEKQPFWFVNIERPVHTVILTDDDVPNIIKKRGELIQSMQNIDCKIRSIPRPFKGFDGRKTRRTAPELFKEYDSRVAAYTQQVSALIDEKTDLQAVLQGITRYSTTLYRITI